MDELPTHKAAESSSTSPGGVESDKLKTRGHTSLSIWKRLFVNPLVVFIGQRKIEREFSKDPIIICGCGRSGTTLLLSILGSHPNIYAIPNELAVFNEWQDSICGLQKKNGARKIPRIDKLCRHMITHKIPSEAVRWCEKTPRNVRFIPEILGYMDNKVKIIHIVRDPRDVLLSRHPRSPERYWIPISRWVADVTFGLDFERHPQVLTVKYEDLVLSYEDSVQKICNFIEEDCVPQIYDWTDHTNVRKNTAWFGSVKKLDPSSIGKWKKEEHSERVEEIMSNPDVVRLMKKLGYI